MVRGVAESDLADVEDSRGDVDEFDERVGATVGYCVIETVPVALSERDPDALWAPEAESLCEAEFERLSWGLRDGCGVDEADTEPDTVWRGVELKAIVIDDSADKVLEVVGLADTDLVIRGLTELDSLPVVLADPLELLELDGLAETEFEFLGDLELLAETVLDFENRELRVCLALNELVREFELLVLEEPV